MDSNPSPRRKSSVWCCRTQSCRLVDGWNRRNVFWSCSPRYWFPIRTRKLSTVILFLIKTYCLNPKLSLHWIYFISFWQLFYENEAYSIHSSLVDYLAQVKKAKNYPPIPSVFWVTFVYTFPSRKIWGGVYLAFEEPVFLKGPPFRFISISCIQRGDSYEKQVL